MKLVNFNVTMGDKVKALILFYKSSVWYCMSNLAILFSYLMAL
jgi:hypothetical protein